MVFRGLEGGFHGRKLVGVDNLLEGAEVGKCEGEEGKLVGAEENT